MKRSSFLLAAIVAAFVVSPAAANGGPDGIAFVQAPEQSDGVCTGKNPTDAFACATQKCVAGGAAAEDCILDTWCFPAGWSADVFVQVQEGPHFHEYLCGWGSKAAVEKAAAVKCDPTVSENLLECSVVRFFDPDGNEIPAP